MNREALDVVVATPPGTGRSCLGRWFSSSHRLLDAASAAELSATCVCERLEIPALTAAELALLGPSAQSSVCSW